MKLQKNSLGNALKFLFLSFFLYPFAYFAKEYFSLHESIIDRLIDSGDRLKPALELGVHIFSVTAAFIPVYIVYVAYTRFKSRRNTKNFISEFNNTLNDLKPTIQDYIRAYSNEYGSEISAKVNPDTRYSLSNLKDDFINYDTVMVFGRLSYLESEKSNPMLEKALSDYWWRKEGKKCFFIVIPRESISRIIKIVNKLRDLKFTKEDVENIYLGVLPETMLPVQLLLFSDVRRGNNQLTNVHQIIPLSEHSDPISGEGASGQKIIHGFKQAVLFSDDAITKGNPEEGLPAGEPIIGLKHVVQYRNKIINVPAIQTAWNNLIGFIPFGNARVPFYGGSLMSINSLKCDSRVLWDMMDSNECMLKNTPNAVEININTGHLKCTFHNNQCGICSNRGT